MAVAHWRRQLAIRVMQLLRSHAIRKQWEREQMVRASAMHDQFVLERCTSHLTQLGQVRLHNRISVEVGRQTAAFAQNLMTAAPFAMHWLLVTRRSKALRASARQLYCVPHAPDAYDLENDSGTGNIAQNMQHRAELMAQPTGTKDQRQGKYMHSGKDACSRKQVCAAHETWSYVSHCTSPLICKSLLCRQDDQHFYDLSPCSISQPQYAGQLCCFQAAEFVNGQGTALGRGMWRSWRTAAGPMSTRQL